MTTPPAPQTAAPAAADSAGDSPSSSGNQDSGGAADAHKLIIILGETDDGKKFRPSDWCDRLHGALRVLGEEFEEAAEYVQLVNFNGQKGVMVDMQLEGLHPDAYRFYVRFAENNRLRTETISQQHWDALHS